MLTIVSASCKKFLDIIPDNIATIENAFALRKEAEKYLFTCYSYLPASGNVGNNPGLSAGDELHLVYPLSTSNGYEIARGNQNVTDPYLNYWEGRLGGKDLYGGIRDCNIFLENVGRVPDLSIEERNRWIAEVKFLKAYYHFYLLRMYGPIPIIKENLPVDGDPQLAKVYRDPVDTCFNYIVQLIDEAKNDLPLIISDPVNELGRITQPIAYTLKARVLVTAASPLFNGNTDYTNLKDNRGTVLFNTTFDPVKWKTAETACKEAVDICHSIDMKLYEFEPTRNEEGFSDTTKLQLNIRNSVNARWNSEIIWGNTNSTTTTLQQQSIPRGLDPARRDDNTQTSGRYGIPLKLVELFYSQNGVPINEDKTWNYNNRYNLRAGTSSEKFYISNNYVTSAINFDREPRFYASLAFDGGVWLGQGKPESSPLVLQSKYGQSAAGVFANIISVTGYYPKKYVHYEDVISASNVLSIQNYPWPEMRLSDLYLLYAEAINENQGPVEEALTYLNLIRERAGIPSVQEAWSQHSTNPSAYTTKIGLRDIIHRERTIELALEGSRYWDLKRWKTAITELNKPITGWTLPQSSAQGYYQIQNVFIQRFTNKDYFWPIRSSAIEINRNLVQNLGW
ncbi:RagB/SusD family nutrient uptake outer membrane protein [Niabella ginsengisoli]|uniref:RagB/SusD family nutrient uptake outer membrane protein n=1 Tax=Niabella ginsengisoli TaxID=522298 RepID=A0ABS9SGS8_9BACT|nr:RagB/SusD family nutrient uptake outer membrane protein [Niabella ginsengisoli]MCH5597571.1 RagB/SusD family nutrient uptake outer membrane protein [Niabella ginsengisoli]